MAGVRAASFVLLALMLAGCVAEPKSNEYPEDYVATGYPLPDGVSLQQWEEDDSMNQVIHGMSENPGYVREEDSAFVQELRRKEAVQPVKEYAAILDGDNGSLIISAAKLYANDADAKEAVHGKDGCDSWEFQGSRQYLRTLRDGAVVSVVKYSEALEPQAQEIMSSIQGRTGASPAC